MKDYGQSDQIGHGQSLDEYLAEMATVFRKLADHTKMSGSLWVVVDSLRVASERRGGPTRQFPLPFELAAVAEKSGWTLRETIIWKKDRTLPWSTGKRLRNLFEYVLLFVKSDEHKFRSDRLRDYDLGPWWLKWPERYNPMGRQPSNIWEVPIPVQGNWRTPDVSHMCPLPEELVKRMILLSSDEGDVVFDPFAGTGVVLTTANKLNRRSAGLDIDPRFPHAYRAPTSVQLDEVKEDDSARDIRRRIIQLRALKFPKVLFQQLTRLSEYPAPVAILAKVDRIGPNTLRDGHSPPVRMQVTFVFPPESGLDFTTVEDFLRECCTRKPLSKFGVAASISAGTLEEADPSMLTRRLNLYESGHTWIAKRSVKGAIAIGELRTAKGRRNQYSYPPILSNLKLQLTSDEVVK